MLYNNEQKEIKEVEALYIIRKNSRDTSIKISSNDNTSIIFTISDNDFDPRNLEVNKKRLIISFLLSQKFIEKTYIIEKTEKRNVRVN